MALSHIIDDVFGDRSSSQGIKETITSILLDVGLELFLPVTLGDYNIGGSLLF